MEVYILIDNKPQGPYPQELVRIHLKSGELKGTDLAAYAGSSDWRPLSVMMESWGESPRATARNPYSIAAIVAVLVLALVVAGVAVKLMRQLPGAVDSPKTEPNATAQIEADGYPKTPAELDKWYVEPPEGQNAATYFLQGADAIQIADEDSLGQGLPLFGQAGFPTNGLLSVIQRKDITRFVQKNEAAWKLIQDGAHFEQARYPINLTLLLERPMPQLWKVPKAAKFAVLWTVLGAANKQPLPAVDAFLVSLAASQSLKDEPLPISQMSRQSCTYIQRAGLQFIFNSVAVSSNDLARLAGALAKIEVQDSEGGPFTRALAGQRILTPDFFQLPSEKIKGQIQELQGFGLEAWTNHTLAEMMTNLRAQSKFMTETYAPEFAMRKETFPGRLKIEQYERSRAAEAADKRFYLAQAMLTPTSYDIPVRREAAGLANVRLMQTAVALEQFRRVNRKYPDSLTELAPKFLSEVPVDPFNGEPLFYVKGAGYELDCRGNTGSPINFKVETPPKL